MTNAKEARIVLYFHCKTCMRIEEKNGKQYPVDHGEQLAAGWTKEGFQIVCENCGKNVLDIDFLNQKVTNFDPTYRAEYLEEFKRKGVIK